MTSLTALKSNSVNRYKDIRISINGPGFVFGDYDVYTKKPVYQYSLRAAHAGASCYLFAKKDFLYFCKNISSMNEALRKSVYEKDMDMLRKLTQVVFNKWYSDLLQENLKVVPDLDPNHKAARKAEIFDSGNAIFTENERVSPKAKQKTTYNIPDSRPKIGIPKKPIVQSKKPIAEDIIQKSGTKRDKTMLALIEEDEMLRN